MDICPCLLFPFSVQRDEGKVVEVAEEDEEGEQEVEEGRGKKRGDKYLKVACMACQKLLQRYPSHPIPERPNSS